MLQRLKLYGMRVVLIIEKTTYYMKDQIKVQTTTEKFQQDNSFTGDQLQNVGHVSSASFKNSDDLKRTLPTGMQKKINPRLFIL